MWRADGTSFCSLCGFITYLSRTSTSCSPDIFLSLFFLSLHWKAVWHFSLNKQMLNGMCALPVQNTNFPLRGSAHVQNHMDLLKLEKNTSVTDQELINFTRVYSPHTWAPSTPSTFPKFARKKRCILSEMIIQFVRKRLLTLQGCCHTLSWPWSFMYWPAYLLTHKPALNDFWTLLSLQNYSTTGSNIQTGSIGLHILKRAARFL